MSDSLWVKTADGLQRVDIEGTGGGGSVSRKVFTSSARDAVLTAGTAFEVPAYTKGDNSLSLQWNGLQLVKEVEYAEATATTVTFSFDIAKDDVISAVVIGGSGVGAVSVAVDDSRDGVLKAGTVYTVTSHSLAENRIAVFLNGVAYTNFHEVTQTTITFDDDIPATMQIVVRVEA